jgi:hypothetical protein
MGLAYDQEEVFGWCGGWSVALMTLLIPAARRTKGFETGNPHETQEKLAATTVVQRSA